MWKQISIKNKQTFQTWMLQSSKGQTFIMVLKDREFI